MPRSSLVTADAPPALVARAPDALRALAAEAPAQRTEWTIAFLTNLGA